MSARAVVAEVDSSASRWPLRYDLTLQDLYGPAGQYTRVLSLKDRPVNSPHCLLTPDQIDQLFLPEQGGPFSVTFHLHRLANDICRRLPDFQHIDMGQVLVSFCQTRGSRFKGRQARLVPLRMGDQPISQQAHGHVYVTQEYFVDKVSMRYLLSFYLPRLLDLSFSEKLITIFHELYHICPLFQGGIRKIGSGANTHGTSQADYDCRMAELAREYLQLQPPKHLLDFLRLSSRQLDQHYHGLIGLSLPTPRLIPRSKVEVSQ